MSTYCVEVKPTDRKCACKSGKSSKCPNEDKQIAKGDIRFGATHETADGHKQTVWRHLCCLTPKVLENIKNAGGVNKIEGYRAAGMKEAYAVVKKQGTYDEVQAAWKAVQAAQSPAKDAENVNPDAPAAIKKRKAAEAPTSAENQVAA